jgi:hypothetical protein
MPIDPNDDDDGTTGGRLATPEPWYKRFWRKVKALFGV